MTNEEMGIIIVESNKATDRQYVKSIVSKRNETNKVFVFFEHEWAKRSEKIQSHVASYYEGILHKLHARSCKVDLISMEIAREFFESHHLQGKNHLGIIAWGIYDNQDLVGVLSLGRHHRHVSEHNIVVLDRLCFKTNVRVVGGASRLFSRAIKWCMENEIKEIVSFSDNRYSIGGVYKQLGFIFDGSSDPDYHYIKCDEPLKAFSKQSQMKSVVACPEGMTELEWAERRGLCRLYDAGKTKWVYELQQSKSPIKTFLHRRQGYYQSKKAGRIYFSSSYELRTAYLLDLRDDVETYSTQVKFFAGSQLRYMDFLVKKTDGSFIIIESKPLTNVPKCQEQINDNKNLAKKNGWEFELWTENELGLNTEYFMRKWADEYLTTLTGIDLVEERKERGCSRAKKYYLQHIATDKVNVYCDYCKEVHSPLRLTYDRNMQRNGSYICERKGGSISGSKPKLHLRKDNPYVDEGKKKCVRCDGIKNIATEFGKDKSRRDGCSSRCLTCRAEVATEKYRQKKDG
jgi:predicted GNAT family N-acyltransferase